MEGQALAGRAEGWAISILAMRPLTSARDGGAGGNARRWNTHEAEDAGARAGGLPTRSDQILALSGPVVRATEVSPRATQTACTNKPLK